MSDQLNLPFYDSVKELMDALWARKKGTGQGMTQRRHWNAVLRDAIKTFKQHRRQS